MQVVVLNLLRRKHDEQLTHPVCASLDHPLYPLDKEAKEKTKN